MCGTVMATPFKPAIFRYALRPSFVGVVDVATLVLLTPRALGGFRIFVGEKLYCYGNGNRCVEFGMCRFSEASKK